VKSSTNFFTRVILILMVAILSTVEIFSADSWKTTVFGDVGGQDNISEENFKTSAKPDGTVEMSVSGNKGKISGSTDGLMFYYTEIPTDENFELTADAEIGKYDKNNQVSFGLMVRDEILVNKSEKSFTSNYIAAGAIDLKGEASYSFNRKDGKLTKVGNFTNNPVAGEKLKLKIKKSGDIYQLTVGNEKPVVIDDIEFKKDKLYIGTCVVRNVSVTFSNIKIKTDNTKVKLLVADSSNMKKTEYLVGQDIDTSGLTVTALTSDGKKLTLSDDKYIITGFDSSEPKKLDTAVNYNGVSAKLDLEVKPLSLSKINIKYYPAKTSYYKMDKFDTAGMIVFADYNNGYKLVELDNSGYNILINNQKVTEENPFVFEKSGKYTVNIQSTENPDVMSEFEVDVKAADLVGLEIKHMPEKTLYFKGDKLNLAGIAVYAKYSNSAEVRLMNDEITVDNLDSSSTGSKKVKIHHKNKDIDLMVKVKNKELSKVDVTTYPKTTYYTGEKFDTKGMVVSKIYDNGDIEAVSDFKVDTTAFTSSTPGVYPVKINTFNGEATLNVTVREKKEYEWKTTIFGQSTTPEEKNFVKIKGDKVEIAALSGGGKITGDHDGITYYYTELDALEDNFTLSADIKVIDYAKKPHDGQESFGIMARDALGVNGDSALFAGNIALVGGFAGGTKDKNGTQLVVRTGVTAPNGKGSKGLQKVMIKDELPTSKNTPYRLTLSKTNSGFTAKIDNGKEVLVYEPEILKVQDKKMYVGFFTARLAHIEVSNTKLQVSASTTDAPKIEKPKTPQEPSIIINSLDRVSLKDYKLRLEPNVNGVLTVKEGKDILVDSVDVTGGKEAAFSTSVGKNAETNFSVVFTPSDTQLLTSYEPIVTNFTVDMRTYQDGKNIYVAPNGNAIGDGSESNPLDLDTAIDFVQPGQTIILKEGRYVRNGSLFIRKYNDGTKKAMKKLVAEKGARPVIDFNKKSEGVLHSGNYWYIYGINFTHSAPNRSGYVLGGNHNIIELCEFYENGNTGMQISRTSSEADNISKWPSYNLIKNCTSYNNADPSENNADGFAAKLTVGYGNIFDGCISHNNADDGWDLYAKVGTGKIGAVTIINSIVYNNGQLEGKEPGNGDGNGFKLGGEGIHVTHTIKNSVAFGNLADGFTSNFNPGVIAVDNIAFNNKRNINFSSYTGIVLDFEIDGFKSYQYNNPLGAESDIFDPKNKGKNNYFYDGNKSVNIKVKELKEVKITMPKEIKRKRNGNIDFSFLGNMK